MIFLRHCLLFLLCDRFVCLFGKRLPTPPCPNQGPQMPLVNNDTTNYDPSEGCPQPTFADLQFILYTRRNKRNGTVLDPHDPFEQIDLRKPLVLASHGWVMSAHGYGMQPLKDAYLRRYDCNVILLDWARIAQQDYLLSVCKIPGLGKLVARFLCTLESARAGLVCGSHLLGHSLGAHLVGFSGEWTRSLCGETVGRVTGLDPAGTTYQNLSFWERLERWDASFVDVIHTNMGSQGYGYMGNLGDVDFYVNCGSVQPGCQRANGTNATAALIQTGICSHYRAVDLMTESVNSDGFVGVSCGSCPSQCGPDAGGVPRAVMGEGCPRNAPRGAYYVKTGTCPPYALQQP